MLKETQNLIIAGPCAAETRDQVLQSAIQAKARNVDILRASLWKPRTRHISGTFQGVAYSGIPWLVEVAKMGITPATEVIMPEHSGRVIRAIERDPELRGNERLMIWLGSRNQNDIIQERIGRQIKDRPWVTLGIKNPMWDDPEHWIGSVEAVLKGGAKPEQLVLIGRGCQPGADGLRNYPNYESAERVKAETNLPLIWDPSHMSGDHKRIPGLVQELVENYPTLADGLITEVYPWNPRDIDPVRRAKTDINQQLEWSEFDQVMNLWSNRSNQQTKVA